ncbi:MAG TPA: HlyD family efflux transporter periplasmic adaptor subunit [Kofleriaceae bacterium]|jgi:multidrug efflux pump subunit AcrA (membrane-fusion protein)|nr:HlyD family efflux transporter periplasmic adaptor subunit [Kofleriaceae bacterium]
MTGRAALGVLAAGFALELAAGCRGGAADSDDPAEPIDIAAPAGRVDDRTDDRPGFLAALTPKQVADVPAPYTSAGAHLAVKLGDAVTAGQIVARLDDRQLRQELDAGRAQLHTAQAAVVQAQVDRRGAEIVLTREKSAEAAGVGSRADLATATQAVAKAAAAVTVARATAEERATRLAQLQAHLSEMTLASPIAGSVALLYAQDGARVEEGRPVLRVISGGVLVQFAIPADKAGSIHPGDLVDLRLDRRPEPLTARVGHVAPELDAVAQMIIADADLVDPPPDLQPGTVGRIVPRPARPAAARPTK